MKRLRKGGSILACAVLLLTISAAHGVAASSAPAGGTQLVNTASATYDDPQGHQYATQSNTVDTTVAQVGALVVAPKQGAVNLQTDGVPQNVTAVRTFTITNSSNITDAYRITAVSVSAGKVASVAFLGSGGSIPVTIGTTISPSVVAGNTIQVQVSVTTTGLAVGTNVSVALTAQTTAPGTENGLQSDSGEAWIAILAGPSLSGPGGGGTKVSKTVNHTQSVQSAGGNSVTFDILAMNAGGSPATNVVVTDTVPIGITPDPASVQIDGKAAPSSASVSGQTLTVKVGTLAADTQLDVSFGATVQDQASLGSTFVNIANLSADGIAPIATTPASVLIGTADEVYDGYGGSGMPVAGAIVSLLDAQGNLVNLGGTNGSSGSSKGVTANAQSSSSNGTQNPVVTGSNGVYAFALQPSQIAAGGTTFYLSIAAPGYRSRRIQLLIKPDSENVLYDVTATAVDGQPIAVAGGFALTSTAVSLDNVFGLFGNLPLFTTQTITVQKSADRQDAQPGDRIGYTISFGNQSRAPLGTLTIVDTMPPGLVYAPGTGRFDNAPSEPAISGNTLTWTLNDLAPGANHTITYDAVVYPDVAVNTQLENSVAVTGLAAVTKASVSSSASVTVQVISGAFTDRSVITGRVFMDNERTGHFTHGDTGVAGVRIYLEDGTAVTTDARGMFDFPSVRPGEHVLRLDPTTLPKGVRVRGDGQQLVHGLLDDGLMQDVNFALESGS